MEIHELNTYAGSLDSNAYMAIDNSADTAKIPYTELMKPVTDRLTADETQISAIQTEVTGARTGADGTVYPSLGDAIRGQVTDLKSELSYTSNLLGTERKIIKSAYISSGGVVTSGGTYDLFCFQVTPNDVLEITVSATAMTIGFYVSEPSAGSTSYDSSRLIYNTSNTSTIIVPSGVSWIAVRTDSNGSVTITPSSSALSDIEALKSKVSNIRDGFFHKFSFALYGYTASAGNLPTVTTTLARFRTSTYYRFYKGETISVKWSGLSMFPIYCNKNGECLNISSNWAPNGP